MCVYFSFVLGVFHFLVMEQRLRLIEIEFTETRRCELAYAVVGIVVLLTSNAVQI